MNNFHILEINQSRGYVYIEDISDEGNIGIEESAVDVTRFIYEKYNNFLHEFSSSVSLPEDATDEEKQKFEEYCTNMISQNLNELRIVARNKYGEIKELVQENGNFKELKGEPKDIKSNVICGKCNKTLSNNDSPVNMYVSIPIDEVEYIKDNNIENDEPIPCKYDNVIVLNINIENGQILNWTIGVSANVLLNAENKGTYYLENSKGDIVAILQNEYVPSILRINDPTNINYVNIDVDENGFIENYQKDFSDFENEEILDHNEWFSKSKHIKNVEIKKSTINNNFEKIVSTLILKFRGKNCIIKHTIINMYEIHLTIFDDANELISTFIYTYNKNSNNIDFNYTMGVNQQNINIFNTSELNNIHNIVKNFMNENINI